MNQSKEPQNQQIGQQKDLQKEQQQKKQSLSSQDDDRYYRDDDSKFDLSALKPFDLKAQWLGNTEDMLKKFQQKLTEVEKQKGTLKKGFALFQENQAKYRQSSLRKIHFDFDKKKIYQQFMLKSRRPIQKIQPGLLLNIGSYVQCNLLFFLAKMRRVSNIFNFIYKNQQINSFLSQKDLGSKQNRKTLQKICSQWLRFERTFLYYKEIKYTDQIPPNSFKSDLQQAVLFINDIYKRILKTQNFEIGYFLWINSFMKHHRVVIALSTLSLTNLIMIRKPSIIAFSNYLALNPSERKKQQITKTRYSQLIKVIIDQDYRDCLIINTKVSNLLQDKYSYDFSVFIIHSLTGKSQPKSSFLDQLYSYNILLFHKHNDQKSRFIRDVELINGNVLDTDKGLCIRFQPGNLQYCQLTLTTDTEFSKICLKGSFMNCLLRDHQNNIKFSQCFMYNLEYQYLILIRNLLDYEVSSIKQDVS